MQRRMGGVALPWRGVAALLLAVCAVCIRAEKLRLKVPGPPFMVSWKIDIVGGTDNEEVAQKVVDEINSHYPEQPMAKITPGSVARITGGTFPPPSMEYATPYPTAQPMNPKALSFPASAQNALHLANQALDLAKDNEVKYDQLLNYMSAASQAHVNGLLGGDTTPAPGPGATTTVEPRMQIGDLVRLAVVTSTPQPPPTPDPFEKYYPVKVETPISGWGG